MKEENHSWSVFYQRSIKYDIVSTSDIFLPGNEALLSVGRVENSRRFILVDSNVYRSYSASIADYFAQNKIEAKIVSFPGGEENKSIDSYLAISKELDSFPIHRRDEPIIAIGGGVLTDTAGFVASSYRRGVPHINVPTTLMGYIDAAVGIKTGINFNGCKNRLGAFYPPLKVLLDRSFLVTLPRRHILNGVSEIIKLAVIKDLELFAYLESHGAQAIAAHFQDDGGRLILDRAITGMLAELQPNLFEDDLARKVDFGHTFSYGFETRDESPLLHGEAVLLDIAISVLIARARNLLSAEDLDRIFRLYDTLGLTVFTDILDPSLLWRSLEERIRHRNGLQRVPLPRGIGHCVFINDVSPGEIQSAVATLKDGMVLKDGKIPERR
jgi:3-dehydroquinate synthetase